MGIFGKSSKVVFKVEGMSCGHCAATVKRQLEAIPGVKTARVSLDDRRATVTYDPGKVTPEAIITTFNGASTYRIAQQ